MGQLTPQQFRNRTRLLQQSNAMRGKEVEAVGVVAEGVGAVVVARAASSLLAVGSRGCLGTWALLAGLPVGFGFATAPMLTAGGMFGGPAGMAGMATGMAGMAGVKTFADFEKSFRRVELVQRSAGATQQHIDMLNRQARDLGRTTIFSAGEAADAMVVLSQRGVRCD
jgi:hypothetical protein